MPGKIEKNLKAEGKLFLYQNKSNKEVFMIVKCSPAMASLKGDPRHCLGDTVFVHSVDTIKDRLVLICHV